MKRAERPMDYAAVRYRNRIAAAGATLAVLAALTACGSSDGGDTSDQAAKPSPKTSKSAEPSASPTAAPDPEDAEKEAAKAAYAHMWDAQIKAYAKADPKGTKLSTYSAAVALEQTREDLKGLKAKGIIATGELGHKVKMTGFKPEKQVPWAGMTDCLDTSKWKYTYRKTGKPVPMPTNRIERYVAKIQVEKWGKQWKVVDFKPSQEPC